MALAIVPGTPRLLVGNGQAYEWHDTGIVARPRLLAEVFSNYDTESQFGYSAALQGSYPDHLYVQIFRARAGEPTYRRRLLKWSQNRWKSLPGPLADTRSTVLVVRTERGMVAVGCAAERCFFQPVQGTPRVPRFSWQAGCATRISEILAATVAEDGTIYVLGNECSSGRVLLESWARGATKSRVEVLDQVSPRPEGFLPNIGLGVFEGEPWVWGLEWFYGGGPVTQLLLTHRAAGTWPLEELPCQTGVVNDFAIWRGYEVAACNGLMVRPPGGDWTTPNTDLHGSLELVDGKLLLAGERLWQFAPPGASDDVPKLTLTLPCPGYAVDLAIDKDFARARKLIRPLGDRRKELVLAATWDDTVFLVAPDESTAASAKATLNLSHDPICLNDQFQTFVTAD